ncbi:MAG: hypothetical protein QF645_11985, partial [Planctomycetota bacterium]|nr:hypothetical protein [Planctomycetota bacterium]
SPPTPDYHQDSFQLLTSVPDNPVITISVTGTSSEGSSKTHAVSVGALSEPSEHDDNDVIFVDGSGSGLIRYDVGSDLTFSMSIPNIIHRAYGRPGSKNALLVRSDDDLSAGPCLSLVTIEANSFTKQDFTMTAGSGEFSLADAAQTPVELQPGVFAIITSGADGLFNDPTVTDDNLTFFNTNTGSITHFTVGRIDETAKACQPHGDSSGTVALSSPGVDGNWGGSDDRVWLLKYDADTDSVIDLQFNTTMALHSEYSVCQVWGDSKAVFLRGTGPDLDFVDIDATGEKSSLTLLAIGGPPVLMNVSLNKIWGEWVIPTDSDEIYLVSNYISEMTLNDTATYAGHAASPNPEIISAFRPTGIVS